MMGDDMIGTLFTSDATSLLDSEASHLLTELESMAADPSAQQTQQYYDFGGGGSLQQQLQPSPTSQGIHSPASSIHSPGAMMSPSTSQQHFGSPPPQQAVMQRQMSQVQQQRFQQQTYQTMQVAAHPQQTNIAQSPGSVMWRQQQPSYPTPALPPQAYMSSHISNQMTGQPPNQMSSHPTSNQLVSHSPSQMSGHLAGQMSGHAPGPMLGHAPGQMSAQYGGAVPVHTGHMQTIHSGQYPGPQEQFLMQQQSQHHMHYQQQHGGNPTLSYMQQHAGMRSPAPPVHMSPHMSQVPVTHHMMTQQPRMPHPGAPASYQSGYMMPLSRLPEPQQHVAMRPPPSRMVQPMSQESTNPGLHQQRMPLYQLPYHNQQGPHGPEMHQSSIRMETPTSTVYGAPLAPMRGAQMQQTPAYSFSQQMASSPAGGMSTGFTASGAATQGIQNTNSLEQLERMVSPLNERNPKSTPSAATAASLSQTYSQPNVIQRPLLSPSMQTAQLSASLQQQQQVTTILVPQQQAPVGQHPMTSLPQSPGPQTIPGAPVATQTGPQQASAHQIMMHTQPHMGTTQMNPTYNQNVHALLRDIEVTQSRLQQTMCVASNSPDQQQQVLELQDRLQQLKGQHQLMTSSQGHNQLMVQGHPYQLGQRVNLVMVSHGQLMHQPAQQIMVSSQQVAPTHQLTEQSANSSQLTMSNEQEKLDSTSKIPSLQSSADMASASEVPSTVDSPALSDLATPSRKNASNKSKSSSKRSKKVAKKPPASLLKIKKRKRKNSSDMSDLDTSPGVSSETLEAQDLLAVRRSERVTKRQKYVDELDLELSGDEPLARDEAGGVFLLRSGNEQVEQPEQQEPQNQLVVEKIIGVREGTRDTAPSIHEASASTEQADGGKLETVKVEEFFVKYKNYSYLHCEWKTAAELEVTDKRIHQKIKRWQQKRAMSNAYLLGLVDEDELFNPEYVEVERVLAESRNPSTEPIGGEVVHYLVKWRQLPYDEATWELEQDVDTRKIEQWRKLQEPPASTNKVMAPLPGMWKALPTSKLYKGENELREYQLEGVNWLTYCYYNRQNCILADEMGLGKTVQSIAFLQSVLDYGIAGPFLVIAPLSTIGNWQREFDTWTDLNVIVYHGSSVSRSMIQEYDMFYKDEKSQRRFDVFKFHAIITTYEVIIQDVDLLTQIEWRCCVIDEAHRLKNKNCKLMEGLRCLEMEHIVLLSGTPLQNNVEELFSLLHFLEPNRFKSSVEFLAEFGNLKTESQVEKLKAILKPMMLRRLKEDVEKKLAPKEETIIEVELTSIQKKYYRAILERNFSFLAKGSTTANVPNLMNTMMELRKCCNHPYLIDGAEEQIIEELKERHKQIDAERLIEAMVQGSGKLVLLDKLLPKLKAGNHKVLIFSQMIRVLDIIEDYLVHKQLIYERIDGRIRGNQRQEAIDRFSKPDSDRFVFLLCTRAGGLGINLTAADTCIIYDSDWNPQNDLQAQARCHRIGQQKAVKVYRLICKNTYEREMFDRASLKLGLDKALLQSMGTKQDSANSTAPLSKQEVEELLRKGAYGALMDDDQAGDQFCEEDIDQILQRRTQVITIESVGKGSTFAKASFSSSGARDDIDINDPEFWQKWAKKAEIDTSTGKNELIIAEPRQRKQTARYGGDENTRIDGISDLESSSDSDPDAKSRLMTSRSSRGRRGRRRADEDYDGEDNAPLPGCYSRPECFKVEKLLLVYGWGRWADMLKHAHFRRPLDELDMTNISQAILLYSLHHYNGDRQIKTFIWDLIMPSEDGKAKDISNHLGLAAPVPRGRKSRKLKKDRMEEGEEAALDAEGLDEKIMTCPIDADSILQDMGYKKHLQRHSNKVLLRVRMLYYLKQEVIGCQVDKVLGNVPSPEIDLPTPISEGEPPMLWWDEEADKCLLIGVFKHGYEKYNAMRADNALCFLARCGPPDGTALAKEEQDEDDDNDKMDDADDDDAALPANRGTPVALSHGTPSKDGDDKFLPFPSTADLNTRLRRVITAYQRSSRRRLEQQPERKSNRERGGQARSRDIERLERRARWTRREEADFYRVVSTYGIETNKRGTGDDSRTYCWDNFRQMANLHKKDDIMLNEYLDAFYYMCCKVCHRLSPEALANVPLMYVDPISEERASRCLARVNLLNKIREEILWHSQLTERLKLCQFSPEIPGWWKPGDYDKDLLIGAAKHGLAHTDQHILYDPKLCFKDLMLKALESEKSKESDSASVKSRHTDDLSTPEAKLIDRLYKMNGDIKTEASNGAETSRSVTEEAAKSDKDMQNAQSENTDDSLAEDPSNSHLVPSTQNTSAVNESINFYWPKDKVIYQRLELVCHCIETGEWPTASIARKLTSYTATASETPTGTPTPSRTATPNQAGPEYSCYAPVEDEEGEGLKLTISRGRSRKPKRSRIDLEAERIARLRDGGDSECSSTPLRSTPDSMLNGSTPLSTDDMYLNSLMRPRKKRGRKSKAEKIAEAKAAVAASYHRIATLEIEPESRVPVVNLENGDRLTGDSAPTRRELEHWLAEHPCYMVDMPDTLSSSSGSQGAFSTEKRGRKPRADPEHLNPSTPTGSDNVAIVHRESMKKSNIPEHQHSRLHTSDKRKRRSDADLPSSSVLAVQQAAATQALLAASLQGFPMNLYGLTPNPLLSMFGLSMPSASDPSTNDDDAAKAAMAAATSAHSAFPFQMYNPLLAYGSLLAAQGSYAAAAQGSYAQALAQAGLLNGLLGYDAASSSSGDVDPAIAEKMATMVANMNALEQMQMRNSKIEELYSRRCSSSREEGELISSSRRKAETVTRNKRENGDVSKDKEDKPEDLSMKHKPETNHIRDKGHSSNRSMRDSTHNNPVQSDQLGAFHSEDAHVTRVHENCMVDYDEQENANKSSSTEKADSQPVDHSQPVKVDPETEAVRPNSNH